jgi:hypothetical protein
VPKNRRAVGMEEEVVMIHAAFATELLAQRELSLEHGTRASSR